ATAETRSAEIKAGGLVDAVESRGVKYRLAAAHPDTQTLNAALAEYDRWTEQKQVSHLAAKQRRRADFLRSLHIFRPPDHFLTHCEQIDALVLLPILEINETGTT
ncbi:MAG: hypothetical protein ACXWLJ_11280, partial [Rhizomicrobium sp.]